MLFTEYFSPVFRSVAMYTVPNLLARDSIVSSPRHVRHTRHAEIKAIPPLPSPRDSIDELMQQSARVQNASRQR